jgi:hypothetical protein
VAIYRKHDCYKCSNEKCNDEFSEFIPSFDATVSGLVECENYKPNFIEQDIEEN